MPSHGVKWRVTYGGPLLDQSEMNVRDPAPSLLAMADLCEAAIHTLYGEALKTRVRVHASFQTGSFGIDLAVDAGVAARILDMFSSHPVDGELALTTMIGTVYKLIGFLRKAGGKKVVSVERDGDTSVVILEDAQRLTVENTVVALLQSPRVRENLYKVLLEDHRRMVVSAVSVAFREDNKWRVTDGNSTYYVSMADADFLRRVDEGEAFAKGDTFVCDMWVRQWEGPTGLSTDDTIEKVVEHRHRPSQLRLPLAADPDAPRFD